jgi:uncharacterized protein DUF4185
MITRFLAAVSRVGAAFVLCAVTAWPAVSAPPPQSAASAGVPAVRPDESWNAVFDRRDGWTGADVAGTVDLGDGRILWLFGDTWIGSIRDGKRMPGARMVNNSIAVHPKDKAAPWNAPDPKAVRFYWGANKADGQPTAWVVPSGETAGLQSPSENREWFWPTGGGLAVGGSANSRRLFLFFFRVQRNPHGNGVWNFSIVGTTLGTIDNAAEPVDRWRVRLLNVPHSIKVNRPGGRLAETEMTWGMTACLDPKTARDKSPDALIYGVRKTGPFNNSLVLARVPAAIVDQFDAWKFYGGKNSWVHSPTASTPIADGMVSEFSIERIAQGDRTTYVLTQSEPFFGWRIFARTASQPQGPWSRPRTVYTVPDVKRNRSYFTYAAKGHAALSRPGELLVTYLVNSNQFADLLTDTQIYRPKFMRLSASLLVSP